MQASNAKTSAIATTPATNQSKRAKQEKGQGHGTPAATQARLTPADVVKPAPEPMPLSPRVVLKPLTIVPAMPQATGEESLNGAQSTRSCQG